MKPVKSIKTLSKQEFLKLYPTLYYGKCREWFALVTPQSEVCALALNTFSKPERILKRFQKHTLIEKQINLPEVATCLLVGTPFQHQVWKALLEIPEGQIWSYQQLANHVKRPQAVRAVANGVGANPISPLIPCHRVIRSNHELGGYFWGLQAKVDLLKKEGVDIDSLKKNALGV